MKSIEDKIFMRICAHGKRWAFSAVDFRDLASHDAIRQAFVRLQKQGKIRRVMTGIYDCPGYSDLLKQQLAPDMEQVAQALARKFGWRIHPTSAKALNMLGLSTQVPARIFYDSDGPSRTYKIGNRTLVFQKRKARDMAVRYDETALVVQAVSGLLPDHLDDKAVQTIRSRFSSDQLKRIAQDARGVSGKIYEGVRRICL